MIILEDLASLVIAILFCVVFLAGLFLFYQSARPR